MPRPVTLFTGQWADLPFEEGARLGTGHLQDAAMIKPRRSHRSDPSADSLPAAHI